MATPPADDDDRHWCETLPIPVVRVGGDDAAVASTAETVDTDVDWVAGSPPSFREKVGASAETDLEMAAAPTMVFV